MYANIVPHNYASLEHETFTYQVPDNTKIGQLVSMPFGRRKTFGIIVSLSKNKPLFAIKEIDKIIINEPILSHKQIDLAKWMSEYYLSPLSFCVFTMVPRYLTKTKKISFELNIKPNKLSLIEKIDPEVEKILQNKKSTLLIAYESNRFKTYQSLLFSIIAQNKKAIVLFPELEKAKFFIKTHLSSISDHIAFLASSLTDKDFFQTWLAIKNGQYPIVIGSHAPLFAPLDPSLIIIENEEDFAYKNDQTPRYHVITAALQHNIPIILGSLSPRIETYSKTINNEILLKEITQKHLIKIIDLKKEQLDKKEFLSYPLFETIKESLNNKKQIILFHGRKGLAKIIRCSDCSYIVKCNNCETPLTLIHSNLKCYHCYYETKLPAQCATCKGTNIGPAIFGTQEIEKQLKKEFPNASIARLDLDLTDLEIQKIINDYYDKKIDILIGTQILFKRFELISEIIGIINADTLFNIPDFNATTSAFTTLSHLSELGSKIIVQTYTPENIAIKAFENNLYRILYDAEISQREKFSYPPFIRLIKIIISHKDQNKARYEAQKLSQEINDNFKNIEIIGPNPAYLSKLKNMYRFQLLLKLPLDFNQNNLKQIVSNFKKALIDVDPISLI